MSKPLFVATAACGVAALALSFVVACSGDRHAMPSSNNAGQAGVGGGTGGAGGTAGGVGGTGGASGNGGTSASGGAGGTSGAGGSSGSSTSGGIGGSGGAGGASGTAGNGATSGSGAVSGDAGSAGRPDQGCGPGDRCCIDNTCDGGGCCVGVLCVAQGDDCGDGLGMCDRGSCGTCGSLGEPCCPTDITVNCDDPPDNCGQCTGPGAFCPDGLRSSTCSACGHAGEPCCISECLIGSGSTCVTRLDPETNSSVSSCVACGHAGEPCCQSNFCDDESCCMNVPGATPTPQCLPTSACGCEGGLCTVCGGEGLPCCEGSVCQSGLGCMQVAGEARCGRPLTP